MSDRREKRLKRYRRKKIIKKVLAYVAGTLVFYLFCIVTLGW